MHQINLLLEKFWNNQITLTELQQLHYLLSIHKDELSNQVNLNLEVVEKEVAHLLTNKKTEELLTAIHTKIAIEKPVVKYVQFKKVIYPLLAAASIIGIILLSVQFLNRENTNPTTTIVATTKQNGTTSITNNQAVNKQVVLPDGSIIILQPNAAITYYQPFINNRRDISLTGNALFKVAKDKSKPFTVYAKGFSTTALGTQFWVYASERDNYRVNLLEGKVVVKVADRSFAMNNVYLNAGQQFNINLFSKNYTVSTNTIKEKHAPQSDANVVIKNILSFTDEPLENVLTQIKNKYQQAIVFNRQDVKGLTFTGSFVATDNMQVVLSVVCNMNDLVFKNTNDTITITKKP